MSMIALSTAKISQASLGSLGSSKIALQAQQYAAAKADFIKATDYDELAEQAIEEIPNSNFYDEVIIGNETLYPGKDDIYQRVCTINVYLYGDVLPRYSLKVVKTSVDLRSSVPPGSILPWHGNLADMPAGFALCDGSNGTPDLRDRFIVGAGNTYTLNNMGGTNENILKPANLPTNALFAKTKTWLTTGSDSNQPEYNFGDNTNYDARWYTRTSGGGGWHYEYFKTAERVFKENGWLSEPIENRPPYYALYYIMKLDD